MPSYYKDERTKNEDFANRVPLLEYLRFSLGLNGANVLHILSSNLTFLNHFHKEVSFQVNDLEKPDALHFIYYVLFTNSRDQSPVSKVIEVSYSPRCVEQMLEILRLNPSFDYFMHFKRFFF